MENNKELSTEEIMKFLEEQAEKSGYKQPIYHDNGLVTVRSNGWVGIMRADVFNDAVQKEAKKQFGDDKN